MSNRTVMPSDAEYLPALSGSNVGTMGAANVTAWIDVRGFSWVDFICEFGTAANITAVTVLFEQGTTLAEPSATYPATSPNVRKLAVESYDSTPSVERYIQRTYIAESPSTIPGGWANQGWAFTVPVHGRWLRMVLWGQGISSVTSSDTVTIRAYRRS